ncbi:MAG: hypothetical protein IJW29_03240 [Clostridia bacterium]|nr:hypothetical protein [Clostridia bacterium]
MKQFGKRVLSLALTLVMMLGILPAVVFTATASLTASGITNTHRKTNLSGSADRWFKPDAWFETEEPIEQTPLSFVAVIKYPNRIRTGGMLLSSYVNDSTPSISFFINTTGRPGVRIIDTEKNKFEYIFYGDAHPFEASTYATHMAFTIDPVAKTVSYYENGIFVETQQGAWGTLPTSMDYRIGGNFCEGNTEYFKGAINHIAIWNTTLTAEQVDADYVAVRDAWKSIDWTADKNLIAAWDITKQLTTAGLDRTGNGNDMVYHQGEGVRPDTFGSSYIDQLLTGVPTTVEAWIYMPACYDTRGGTMIGNYKSGSEASYFAFEIQNNGMPRCFIKNSDGTAQTLEFTGVDVRNDKWTHVAFVLDDENDSMYCYINGTLANTQACTISFTESIIDKNCYFAGDRQSEGMTQRFNGFIKELRVYQDLRTATEVALDYAGQVDYSDENIVLHYDLRNVANYTSFKDLTGNGHDVTYTQKFFSEVEPVKDYAYSFAVVGDTQTVTYKNADKLPMIYQWILDNQEEKNIQYVIGLGDITEKGEDWGHKNNDTEEETAVGDAEWAAALAAISLMDGKIPYTLIRGAGHDGVERFNEWFGDHEGYTSQIDGYYKEGRIENTYHTFTVGDINYMILCLDFGAKDDVLEWANEVVAAHPSHRVIVTTHAYLDPDGSLLETGEPYCPSQSYYDTENNDGDDIWNKFVRKHANICMVLCGHMTTDDVVVSKQTGDHGNEVTQILIDPQGLDTTSAPRGMVAMLYFSEDGQDVQVEYYSTITDTWRPNSSFTVSYGSTEVPSYDDLSEDYVIAQDKETGLYTVLDNDFFRFLGGSLRYADAVEGHTNIRFGYQFVATFDLDASNWSWNYGVAGDGDWSGYIKGKNKTDANVTNLVITGVPVDYYSSNLESELVFDVTIDGVTYTITDRVRTRSVLGVAQGMAANPDESQSAKDYAQTIIDACAS